MKKWALNSQLQALQILANDEEVENWSLSSFLLAVLPILKFDRTLASGIFLKNEQEEKKKYIQMKYS